MRTPDMEGAATHDGPESCVGVREGQGEPLTVVRAGWAVSREIKEIGVPTQLTTTGRPHLDMNLANVSPRSGLKALHR